MRTLEMHYQCESQVQHSLLFGLTSYAMFVSQSVIHCWNFIPQLSAFMLTRALPLPWRSMQFLGGILLLSANCSYYLFLNIHIQKHIHIQVSIYRIWILQPITLLNLISLQFFSCFFFGSIQCLLT